MGLYDMHGNIWEWTSDTLRFSSVAQTDPISLEDLVQIAGEKARGIFR